MNDENATQGPYRPHNPDLRHGLDEENPLMAAPNKQPAGSRPGPIAPKEHSKIAGGNSDAGSGEGTIKNKEATPEGPANKNVLR